VARFRGNKTYVHKHGRIEMQDNAGDFVVTLKILPEISGINFPSQLSRVSG